MHLVFHGELFLVDPLKTDASGQLISPLPGQQRKVQTNIAGVHYAHSSDPKRAFLLPNPKLAVAPHRLAKTQLVELEYFRVSKIVWGGIGHWGDGKAPKCHEIGTCVDIYGAQTCFGYFDVYNGWGRKPVFDANGKKLAAVGGDYWATPPAPITAFAIPIPGCLLLPRGLLPRLRGPIHRRRQRFTRPERKVALKQGANVFHPDYPGTYLRPKHVPHDHFQIGPSFL